LPHLTSTPFPCHAPPHTPKGVVVWQLHCLTCHTFAEPQLWQVWQTQRTPCCGREHTPQARCAGRAALGLASSRHTLAQDHKRVLLTKRRCRLNEARHSAQSKAPPTSDPALVFISSTICLVRLITVTTCISGFALVSAQAGERWPQNVCNEISSMESDTKAFWPDPGHRALVRSNLLVLLKYHCGVDTRAKEQFDDAALAAWDKRNDSNARAAVPPPPSWSQGPTNCIIRNLGGDGQRSTMSCQ
jgi:hypothetical protein